MGRAFLLSVGQLGDRAILSVLAKSVALTIALFAALAVLLGWLPVLLAGRFGWTLPWQAAGVIGTAAAVVLGWFLFRAVAIAVIGLFGDEIVVAVEARHYPDAAAKARAVPWHEGAAMALASVLRALAVNLLALPIYLLLLVTGIGAPVVLLVANGWTIGRDLGDAVAVRHLDRTAVAAWRRRTRARRFLLGVVVTLLLLVPLVGLIAPVLGAAMATHLFHRSMP